MTSFSKQLQMPVAPATPVNERFSLSDPVPLPKLDLKQFQILDLVQLNAWPTLEEISASLNVSLNDLPAHVEKLLSAKPLNIQTSREPWFAEALSLVQKCFHATRNGCPANLEEFRNSVSSLENFRKHYFKDLQLGPGDFQNLFIEPINLAWKRSHALSAFAVYISETGIASQVHLYRNLEEPEVSWTIVERLSGSTASAQFSRFRGYRIIMAASEVLTEFEQQSKCGDYPSFERASYFHSSTSAALPGIARQRALLSRTKLSENGERVLSGECADFVPQVYVDDNFNYGKQYSHIRWFDEFPIVIGFAPAKVLHLIKPAPDHGISLGDRVPAETISAIYAPHQHLPAVRDWVAANGLTLDVKSLEAKLMKYW